MTALASINELNSATVTQAERAQSAETEAIWDSKVLEALFTQCFFFKYATKLVGGAQEPLYLPATQNNEHHQIFYRFDYFSSALHEVAHWCIAGNERRQIEDYGYWYEPDGRNTEQQWAFQKVEVKPQAIEMAFSLACNKPFRVSIDNIDASQNSLDDSSISDEAAFSYAVTKQYHDYCKHGFPPRAQQFIIILAESFNSSEAMSTPIKAIHQPSHRTSENNKGSSK